MFAMESFIQPHLPILFTLKSFQNFFLLECFEDGKLTSEAVFFVHLKKVFVIVAGKC